MSGAGAAGTAIFKLLLAAGVGHVVVADIDGHRAPGPAGDLPVELQWLAENTNHGLTWSAR